MFFSEKGYCRFCGDKCLGLKIDKKNPHISSCKKFILGYGPRRISTTTPVGGNIKSPTWCPKLKKN